MPCSSAFCSPLATVPVLSPLALDARYLLENREKSHLYQKLPSIFYGKCAPFILTTELICILTKTREVEGTLKTSVPDSGGSTREWPADLFSHKSSCSTQQCSPQAKTRSVTRRCITLEMLTPLCSSRPDLRVHRIFRENGILPI